MKYRLLIIILSFSLQSLAGGVDKLMEYIIPSDSMINKNKAAIINDQSSGFVTGGSILMRGPRPKNLTPLSIQTPNFSFDACTGSGDFRFGSLSYITSEEFIDFFKNVSVASGAYMAKMLIKTMCPQCEDIMSQLEEVARAVNGMTMNQCSLAQKLVDGSFSKFASAQKQECLMRSKGRVSDLHMGMKECQKNPSKFAGEAESEMGSMLGTEFNLVWAALTNKGAKIDDKEFLELIMSISGTIIGQQKGGKWEFHRKHSLFTKDSQIQNYIGGSGGSKIEVYICDETKKCLNPTENQKTIENQTFLSKIEKLINSITEKIIQNSPLTSLTAEEEDLISFSSVPLINLIEKDLVLKGNKTNAIISNPELVEVIAYDYVVSFLQDLLDKADKAVKELELGQNDQQVFESFQKDINSVKKTISEVKMTAFKRAEIVMNVKENMELQSRSLDERISRIVNNLGDE
jgi:conjugative transfer pilus assembly protein TraH